MKVVTATNLRDNLSESLKKVSDSKDYLLVARRGKVASALVNIELFEELLCLADKEFVTSIKKARQEYEEGDVVSHEDVFGDI